MAITVGIAITSVGPVLADSQINGVLTVTNNGSNTVQIQAAQLSELTTMGLVFRHPDVLTPNAAPGTYNTISAAGSASYPFSLVAPSPNTPGASPNTPNGYSDNVFPPANVQAVINCLVTAYDTTAAAYVNGSASLSFAIGSAVAPFPVPQGGALQFNSGGDAVHWFFL